MVANTYINNKVDEIANNPEFEFPKNLAMAAAWVLGNLKGVNLKVYDVRGKSSLADFYVIGSAANSVQSNSMADEITRQLKRHNGIQISREGVKADAEWTLLDFGDVIIHIFQDNSRDSYSIDELWEEATPVEIPTEYYFSDEEPQAVEEKDDSDENFF